MEKGGGAKPGSAGTRVSMLISHDPGEMSAASAAVLARPMTISIFFILVTIPGMKCQIGSLFAVLRALLRDCAGAGGSDDARRRQQYVWLIEGPGVRYTAKEIEELCKPLLQVFKGKT